MKTKKTIIFKPHVTVALIIIFVLSMFLNAYSEPAFSRGAPIYFFAKIQSSMAGHGQAEKEVALPQAIVTHESVTSGRQTLNNGITQTFSISQNYPNPFNPTTTISYHIPKDGFVKIKVYDSIGREVMTLVNDKKSIGTYSTVFSGQNIASGIYFYTIETNNFIETKRMMLIK